MAPTLGVGRAPVVKAHLMPAAKMMAEGEFSTPQSGPTFDGFGRLQNAFFRASYPMTPHRLGSLLFHRDWILDTELAIPQARSFSYLICELLGT